MKIKILILVLFSFYAFSLSSGQNSNKKFVVKGKVIDVNQDPISGALILLDGENTNIVTDDLGNYRLRVRPDADSITVFTLNSGVYTVAISGQTTINFTLGITSPSDLKFSNKQADDKVIDIGYGSIKQKDLLNNVSSIDGRNSKYASYKDIYEILKGTAGVIVNGKSVKIQGVGSFNSGTEPLYIVDGAAVENVDNIAPYLVESISVLKGAATSIYGSRGANGVILIELSKGGTKKNK